MGHIYAQLIQRKLGRVSVVYFFRKPLFFQCYGLLLCISFLHQLTLTSQTLYMPLDDFDVSSIKMANKP